MKFMYWAYSPILLLFFVLFARFFWKGEKRFFVWVEQTWFFKKSFSRKLSQVFFLLGSFLLLFSLLDLRGHEAKVSAEIPEQKTIILIDTSASMLVEDIRPNRFSKALLLAKHLVKSAVGHQISIILFSDNHKKLVPFTDDVDLLEARISALETMDIRKGGSNIGQAIQESIQYFRGGEKGSPPRGNLVILTDGEENDENFPAEVPNTVSIALVGIGTANGGPIPMRDSAGSLIRYKTFGAETVTSKLNENFFKDFQGRFKNSRYWIAASYIIPTEEILAFFAGNHSKQFQSGEMRVRPVKIEWTLVPAILFLIVSYVLKMRRNFLALVLLMGLFVRPPASWAQQEEEKAPEIDPALAKEISKYSSKLKEGKLGRDQQLDLAYHFLQANEKAKAILLYQEALSGQKIDQAHLLHFFNYGSALLAEKQLAKGVEVLNALYNSLDDKTGAELKKKIRENILYVLTGESDSKNKKQDQKEEEKNKEEQEKDGKDQKENQEQQEQNEQNQQSSENKEQEQGKDQKQQEKQSKPGQTEEEKKEEKEKEKKNEQEKKQEEEGQKKEEQTEKKTGQAPDKNMKKKIPALLKQILNDDRKVQEKILDPTTEDKAKGGRNYKDW